MGNRALGSFGSCCGCAGGPPFETCSPCSIPKANLTATYTDIISGGGSVTLVFGGGSTWTTACFLEFLEFELSCVGGSIFFELIGFTLPDCTGGSTVCSTANFKMTLSSYTCSPFSLTFTVNNSCTFQGTIQSVTVTYP